MSFVFALAWTFALVFGSFFCWECNFCFSISINRFQSIFFTPNIRHGFGILYIRMWPLWLSEKESLRFSQNWGFRIQNWRTFIKHERYFWSNKVKIGWEKWWFLWILDAFLSFFINIVLFQTLFLHFEALVLSISIGIFALFLTYLKSTKYESSLFLCFFSLNFLNKTTLTVIVLHRFYQLIYWIVLYSN